MVSLRQESLGKEEETRTRKPFAGTLRVRVPPGKAGPAARSESCVAVGRPTLRSVDSEVKGRVIEPRNYKPSGAFVLDTGGGRVRRVALGPTGRVWSYRGRRARTMTTRVLQEPERPRRFHRNIRMGRPEPTTPWPPVGRPRPRGAKPRAKRWYRLVKNSKRVETGGGESERPVVSLKRGNHSSKGPRGEKGTPCHDTVGGKHGECIETRGRVHETTTDRGSELMT